MNTSTIPIAKSPNRKALTRCWVVWNNGWKKTYYSYDTSGRYNVADPRAYGVKGLKRMVEKWGDTVAQAIIYDTVSDQKIESYQRGVWVLEGSC